MEPNPKTFVIDSMFDVKSWITLHLDELHGLRDPYCFKFILNEDCNVLCIFRIRLQIHGALKVYNATVILKVSTQVHTTCQ